MDNKTNVRGQGVIDLTLIRTLYREHADALRLVREARRAHHAAHPALKVQLDDVEAEISYLLLRHFRPSKVVEIGSLHGWSTGWLLHALQDNGTGTLITMDLIDNATHGVPEPLAEGRWEFRQGDARKQSPDWLDDLDYLFIDADHSARFARWYLRDILPRLKKGTPASVHDVFHREKPLPFTEGIEVLSWLYLHAAPYFTAARLKAPLPVREELANLRRELDLGPDIHHGRDNPMIFFRTP